MTQVQDANHKVVAGDFTPKPSPAADQPTANAAEKAWKPDDDQIAIELADELAGKIAYFHSSWRVYEQGVWVSRDVYELRRYIRQELRKWRMRGISVSQSRIKALASMLEDDMFIADRLLIDEKAEQRRYINLRNGMFNLDTMEFEPRHDPRLHFTTQLDFDYDPDANCPTFMEFLYTSLVLPGVGASTDDDLVRLLLEGMGYSMTARTDLKASFWLVGQKDSGKSTFISILKSIMGSLHATIDLTQLGINRFILAGIVGKRVVTFTEASSSGVLPDALYKAIVGGSDEIQADVKNRDPITFVPEAKIWWAMNEVPRVVDRSGATTRRIFFIPFNRTIPENQRIASLETLCRRERPGIFNEMVIHYQRLVRNGGFEPCAQSEAMRQQYISENDTEATFVEECCERHESYRVQSSDIYAKYRWWCEERGFKPKNFNQIAGEWRRLGFGDSKSHGVTIWEGVRLKK